MLLITTSAGISKINIKSVLLGEWCKLDFEEKNKHFVCKYHWDDQKKLSNDYLKIKNIYESYLNELSISLNNLHNIDFSRRQWEIIIGPWLRTFISVCYDRYECLKKAIDDYKITTILKTQNNVTKCPINCDGFFRNLNNNDSWNQNLIIDIINETKIIQNFKIKLIPFENNRIERKLSKTKNFKLFIKNLIQSINKSLVINNKIVFHGMDISILENLKLNFNYMQFPLIMIPANYEDNCNKNLNLRKKLILKNKKDIFLNSLNKLIIDYIPNSYIESFKSITNYVNKNYPKEPKIIITSTSYYTNDFFKIWVSQKINEKSKYIIHQHGGNYGVSRMNDTEELQLRTADKFISWGWKNQNLKYNNKIIPLPSIKLSILKNKWSNKLKPLKNGKIVFPLYEWPRLSYRLYSVPIASQQLTYNKEVLEFSKNLNIENKNNLMFRMPPVYRGWNLDKKLIKEGFKNSISKEKNTFIDDLTKSKIAIINANSTTILETFLLNFPTLLFLNKEHWKINKESQYYFDMLSDVNIMFNKPQDAANWLNINYSNIESWWYDKDVQSVVKIFSKKFALGNIKFRDKWLKQINSLYRP